MIQTRGLRYRYPGGAELAFADLDLPQGATLLLRGNSGAGKSTWLALVGGLLSATQGTVTVAEQALGPLTPAARDAWRARTLGFLPQKLHLSEALTVAQNLSLVFFAAGLPDDGVAVARVLEGLGLAELSARKPAQLSGGQAQRVALARAVLLNPKVILVDEPTASLDDDAAAAALQLLETSARRCGATLVIATHDARAVRAFGAAVMHQIGPQPASRLREPL